MLPPNEDIEARQPIWNSMQMLWMDSDPAVEIAATAKLCASSKYSMDELRAIFLNEVRPAVAFNLGSGVAPEWAGFQLEWLTDRILKTHKFGKTLPTKLFCRYAYKWWSMLEAKIARERAMFSSP